jgi:hypothetical protein
VEEENLNLKTVEELNIKLRELHCLLTWRLFNPNEVSQYTIGVNTDNIKKEQLTMSNMPMVRGGLTAANLKLVDPKASPDLKNAANNFMQNRLLILTQTSLRFISLVETTLERCLAIVQKL